MSPQDERNRPKLSELVDISFCHAQTTVVIFPSDLYTYELFPVCNISLPAYFTTQHARLFGLDSASDMNQGELKSLPQTSCVWEREGTWHKM